MSDQFWLTKPMRSVRRFRISNGRRRVVSIRCRKPPRLGHFAMLPGRRLRRAGGLRPVRVDSMSIPSVRSHFRSSSTVTRWKAAADAPSDGVVPDLPT